MTSWRILASSVRFTRHSGVVSAEPHSPPRRGGEAAPLRKCREATEAARTGWSARQALDFPGLLLRLRPIGLALRATSARQLLLSCRATPLRGGECHGTRGG